MENVMQPLITTTKKYCFNWEKCFHTAKAELKSYFLSHVLFTSHC